MKYFSMFSGIGGFEYGIERAFNNQHQGPNRNGLSTSSNLRHDNSHQYGKECTRPTCVGYSEINKYANAIYNYHYPTHKNYGNAKDIVPESIPDFELLVGGFPCQSFSIAGKRGGFDDARGTLFFDVARVLKAKRPKWFLLENVKGLCSHDSGKTLSTIYGVLTDLDYTVGWEVVNSCQFGVPQNRERIFLVGHLTEAGGRTGEVLPVREGETSNYQVGVGRKISACVSRSYHKGHNFHNQLVRAVLTPDRLEKRQNGRRFKENEEPSFTLTSQDKHGVQVGTEIRRLTPVECERLQGFPDGWTEHGIMDGEKVEISDTQRYKALGNAVTTNVIEAFIRKILLTTDKPIISTN